MKRPLGFLTEGYFSSTAEGEDFSEAYTYDMNANILTVRRAGLKAGGGWGTVVNSSIVRDGNLPTRLMPRADVLNPMESRASVAIQLPSSFSFDANGCMTRDGTRGISEITYNALNLPETVTFSSGDEISYVYAADGRKLRESYTSADGLSDRVREYCGSRVFVDGVFDRMEVPTGYITAAGSYCCYIRDFRGDIVAVGSELASRLAQQTDYYAYGQPHGDATYPETNRRKFSGKEYATEYGLDEYDFEARRMAPHIGHFTTPDPLAHDNPSVSPWAFCNSDPINFSDPTGLSTWVELIEEGEDKGKYRVVGGDLTDKDLNIYIVDHDGNRTGTILGKTTSITSFYNSDTEEWQVGCLIDMNDTSGAEFLGMIVNETPPLSEYMLNALPNQKYDFKKTNGVKYDGNLNPYRGMKIGHNSSGIPIVTSARDIGNIAAGYVAAVNGISWTIARFGFNSLQFLSNLSPQEGISTTNAEYYGWRKGRYKTFIYGN